MLSKPEPPGVRRDSPRARKSGWSAPDFACSLFLSEVFVAARERDAEDGVTPSLAFDAVACARTNALEVAKQNNRQNIDVRTLNYVQGSPGEELKGVSDES
jgi:hypothetical protein